MGRDRDRRQPDEARSRAARCRRAILTRRRRTQRRYELARRGGCRLGWNALVRQAGCRSKELACRGARLPTVGSCAGQSRTNTESSCPRPQDFAHERSPRPGPLRTDARAHREAGVLLRRLHESRPARTQQPSDRGRTAVLLDGLLARRPGLFTPVEVAFVGSQANRINDLPLARIHRLTG